MVRPIAQTRYSNSPVKQQQPQISRTFKHDEADRRSLSPKRPIASIRFAALLSGAFASVIVFALTSGMLHTPALTDPSSPNRSVLPAVTIAASNQDHSEGSPKTAVEATPVNAATSDPTTRFLGNLPADFPPQCHYIDVIGTSTKESFKFNARAFCLMSSVCIKPADNDQVSTLYTTSDPSATTCLNETAGFNPHSTAPNCTHIQSLTKCAHGRYRPPRTPSCPTTASFSSLTKDDFSAASWTDDIAFIIPSYPHLRNIFHFSFVAGSIAHLTTALPALLMNWRHKGGEQKPLETLRVALVFRGEMPDGFGRWQNGVLNFTINERLKAAGIQVSIRTLNESVGGDLLQRKQRPIPQLFCAKAAVLIGLRSHVNLWPFPSSKGVRLDGESVPVEAVAFRKAAYKAFGIERRVPGAPRGAMQPPPQSAFIDLPPMGIGYARRNIYPDPTKDNPYQEGTKRRFSDADEAWFMRMLKEEAAANNMTYTTLQSSGSTPLSEQAKMFSNVGLVAGIHGANLMNAVFMAPFSFMLEVFPAEQLACYVAGANSGLRYVKYHPVRKASGEESGCPPKHPTCWTLTQNRRVIISEEEDHRELVRLVRQGIDHVTNLRRKFMHLGAVPVVYDDSLSHYRIDWDRQQ